MSGMELLAIGQAMGGASGAGAMGAGLTALAQVQASKAQASALQGQADVARQNAAAQRQAGANAIMSAEAEAAREQEQGRRQRASFFNQRAGMGVDAADGSSVDVLADMAAGSALDSEIARWRGSQENAGRVAQSNALLQEAEGIDAQARQTRKAGMWQAAGTLMSGGRQLYQSGGSDMRTAGAVWRKAFTPTPAPMMKGPA